MNKFQMIVAGMFLIVACGKGAPGNAGTTASTRPVPQPGVVLETTSLDIDFSKHTVTFIELGAKSCIPCKAMQPVMKDLAAEYRDQLLVLFYDVWEDNKPAAHYKVMGIPTQVFLDAEGKEFHRHIGFYAKEEIRKVLESRGLKRVGN
jgi:thioredoxin 1